MEQVKHCDGKLTEIDDIKIDEENLNNNLVFKMKIINGKKQLVLVRKDMV